jgi:hypothetical protein
MEGHDMQGLRRHSLRLILPLLLCLLWPAAAFAFEDVTSHGATGNGFTDDTVAIQNAINAIPATGGAIYFPPGTYIISNVDIAAGRTIRFFGDGANASILKHKSFSPNSMITSSGVADDIQFHDLGFDGNGAVQTNWELDAIEIKCARFRAESCAFVGTIHGAINLDEVEEVAWILNSSFTEMKEHGGTAGQDTTALLMNATTTFPGDITVSGNYFHADPPAVDGTSPGGVMINAGIAKTHRVIIKDNVFYGIGQDHSDNHQSCIQLYRNSPQAIIQGNKFYNHAFHAITAQRSDDLLIADNIIEGESTNRAIVGITITGRNDSGLIEQNRAIIARNIIRNTPSCVGILLGFDIAGKGVNIQVIDNIMDNVRSGIALQRVKGGILVKGNIIRNVVGGATKDKGVYATFCEGWVHITQNYINGVANQPAISFSDALTQPVDVVISENLIENVADGAFNLKLINRASITNNIFSGTPGTLSQRVVNMLDVDYVQVHGNIAPPQSITSYISVASLQEYGNTWNSSFKESLSGSATWDPTNLAAGAVTSTTITVPGAAVGDPANASHDQIGANSIIISAHVEAASTVRVTLMNTAGSAINTPNGTISAEVFKILPRATVFGRHILYNNSFFDGDNASANAADDGAIATDKTALLPGQTATFANYTSFGRGINGIIVDISSHPSPGSITAADFEFRVGNNNDPNTWPLAAAPTSVSARTGDGAGGSDRITIIWADNAIDKTWLQVTVKVADNDVFYFGNAIGESGNSGADAIVDIIDEDGARNNQTGFSFAAIDNVYDYNRDRRVTLADMATARDNPSGGSTLELIILPVPPAASAAVPAPDPEAAAAASDSDTIKVKRKGKRNRTRKGKNKRERRRR